MAFLDALDLKLQCTGKLGEYAACQCDPSVGEFSCINAQFVDTNVFLEIANNYRNLKSVTFHGNNFQDLPKTPFFGASSQDSLLKLNLSANYIVNLNGNAMKHMPNLQVLDISNNEIVFRPRDVDFLTHTPHLTQLYMRRAFTVTINRTQQFELMLEMFRLAKLEYLQILDLSYNFIHNVPYELPCPFPSLQTLDLRQNFLKNFVVNASCIKEVNTINLARNQFNTIPKSFQMLADKGKPHTFILKNQFYCDCNSKDFIVWIRSTKSLRDKSNMFCDRASPKILVGTKILDVPIDKLTCDEPLVTTSTNAIGLLTPILLMSILSLSELIF
ncbi:unnamed protein product [Caenorhabditis bovis]|uniref:LRRCT domain-containing protein n=1 Tax=Caenorhabditis bovis TaxID=2654633 RepID=A0A8S1FFC8_9PELO|nr:unnamed protein product [Caenorhabditis bovis]